MSEKGAINHEESELCCPAVGSKFGWQESVKTIEALGHLTALHLNQVPTGYRGVEGGGVGRGEENS